MSLDEEDPPQRSQVRIAEHQLSLSRPGVEVERLFDVRLRCRIGSQGDLTTTQCT